jgi:hypothetical protein
MMEKWTVKIAILGNLTQLADIGANELDGQEKKRRLLLRYSVF